MSASDTASRGRIVIGTVRGDLHDIGKNLVHMMFEGAGYDVLDLRVDVTPEAVEKCIIIDQGGVPLLLFWSKQKGAPPQSSAHRQYQMCRYHSEIGQANSQQPAGKYPLCLEGEGQSVGENLGGPDSAGAGDSAAN
jgi:hypothetical protein